jgi:hypothetical protein
MKHGFLAFSLAGNPIIYLKWQLTTITAIGVGANNQPVCGYGCFGGDGSQSKLGGMDGNGR